MGPKQLAPQSSVPFNLCEEGTAALLPTAHVLRREQGSLKKSAFGLQRSLTPS